MVVIQLNKMDVSRLTFKEPMINPFTKTQHICKIAYDDEFLNLQTNYMYQNQHDGIPRIGRFTKDEKARGFYKIIFHNEDDQLMKTLLQIDSIASNLNNKVITNKEKYQYIPIVKQLDEEDYKPPFIKLKINLDQQNKPLVKVFKNINGTRNPIEVETLDELTNMMQNAKLRFIISFNKLYINRYAFTGKKKMYGIILELTHIEIVPQDLNSDEEEKGGRITRRKS